VTVIDLQLPVLHAGQRRVLAEARRFNVLQCGRRWGKTTLGVDILLNAALDGQPTAWFAPTYRMQAEVWRALRRTLGPMLDLCDVSIAERRIGLPTGGTIELWSLDNPDSGRGRAYGTMVIDEAAYVRELLETWQASLRPMLTDLEGTAWFTSTPRGADGFHQLYLRGQQERDGWASWRMPTSSNPHIPPAEIDAAREELPDLVFRQEYLGEPADDIANPFGSEAIRAVCTLDEPTNGQPAAWGVDLAKSHDWTVAIALDADGVCTHMHRWRSDWRNTTRRLQVMLQVPALVDSTGVGDPIVEELARQAPYVEGFKFTATSRQSLLEGLAMAIQTRAIRIPRDLLMDELMAFRFDYSRGGVRYAAPPGVHDDAVMALALAVRCRSEASAAPLVLDVGHDDDW
jgi:phage FluMu gp28-like protein